MKGQLRFDGQVAIVTGAGRGVGRAHAELLAARGAAVVVNDIGFSPSGSGEKSSGPADEVVSAIKAAGGRAVASYDDASTAEGCQHMVELALEHFGGIHMLIANAGTIELKLFGDITEADFDFQMRQHVNGCFNATKAVWPHFAQNKYGRIVLTTSGIGYFGFEKQLSYGAAKGAIHGMMRTLALEGAPLNIAVNAFWPSAFTRMVGGDANEELKARMQRNSPASLAAPVAVWLTHGDCPLTGEVLHGGSGRASRVFVAETRGYYQPGLTLEDVAENQQSVLQEDGYFVFRCAADSSVAQAKILEEYNANNS
ncbi:MAG: SDR family NAD(P)-dependent oxidoreductase [Spongiibacteraceae bacterium]